MTEIYFDDLTTFNKRHSYQGVGETKDDIKYGNSLIVEHAGFFVEEQVIVGNSGFNFMI